ncbi:MAG: hypothetical protein ACFFDI_05725 [Promethearchaeota archaeon]
MKERITSSYIANGSLLQARTEQQRPKHRMESKTKKKISITGSLETISVLGQL